MNDELINRSELLTAISRYSTLMNRVWPMWIEAVINTEPAVDAVPVIRCKDCIRHGSAICPMMHIGDEDYSDEDGYCFYGEKAEGDTNV